VPKLLSKTLLVDLIPRNRLLLCLDYDGTLAETTLNPKDAKPLSGTRDAVQTLSFYPDDVVIAVLSGRDAQTTRRMLGIFSGLYYVGLHGIELLDRNNRTHMLTPVKHCLPALHSVRDWLIKEARESEGFMVEDKDLSVSMHYRNAQPAAAQDMVRQLEYYVNYVVKGLRITHGDMVAEVIPSNTAGKGFAISHIRADQKDPKLMPVYFGSDPSDEEAFFAVRREHGVTVMVGAERNTHAEYRAESPADVIAALSLLANMLVRDFR